MRNFVRQVEGLWDIAPSFSPRAELRQRRVEILAHRAQQIPRGAPGARPRRLDVPLEKKVTFCMSLVEKKRCVPVPQVPSVCVKINYERKRKSV